MSDNKKYYWLKLDQNFFEDDTIQWLEEQKNGKDYVIFYLKLMLKSLKDDGSLIRYVGERLIPYDVTALSKLTNTNEDTVAVAMKAFVDIGLVEIKESGEIYMSQISEMVGTETQAAQRMRRMRARNNDIDLIETNENSDSNRNNVQESYGDVQKRYTELEIDIEIEEEKDIEKDSPDSSDEKYGDDSPYMQLAKRLFGHIQKRNPKHKEPNWQTWADDFRKTIELDQRDAKEATAILDWCQNDDFWQNNILSPAKFRKQYDKLYLKVQKVKPQKREWDEWDALS